MKMAVILLLALMLCLPAVVGSLSVKEHGACKLTKYDGQEADDYDVWLDESGCQACFILKKDKKDKEKDKIDVKTKKDDSVIVPIFKTIWSDGSPAYCIDKIKYAKFGDHSIVIEQNKVIEDLFDAGSITWTLTCDGVTENEIFAREKPEGEAFGANVTASADTSCTYSGNSSVPLIPHGDFAVSYSKEDAMSARQHITYFDDAGDDVTVSVSPDGLTVNVSFIGLYNSSVGMVMIDPLVIDYNTTKGAYNQTKLDGGYVVINDTINGAYYPPIINLSRSTLNYIHNVSYSVNGADPDMYIRTANIDLSMFDNSLIGYWECDNYKGQINDLSGIGYPLQKLYKQYTAITSKFDGISCGFDGVRLFNNAAVVQTANYNQELINNRNYSISFWFYTTKDLTDVTQDRILDLNNDRLKLDFWSLNRIRFTTYNGSVTDSIYTATGSVNEGDWNHVTITISNNGENIIKNIYLNSTLQATKTLKTEYNENEFFMTFGNNRFGQYTFDGLIDNMMFFNRSLTAPEVSQLHTNYVPVWGDWQGAYNTNTSIGSPILNGTLAQMRFNFDGGGAGKLSAYGIGFSDVVPSPSGPPDLSPPNVTLNYPDAGMTHTVRQVDFNFTTTDTGSCDVVINDLINNTLSPSIGDNIYSTDLADAAYTWYVNCTDGSSNLNHSEIRSFTQDACTPSMAYTAYVNISCLLDDTMNQSRVYYDQNYCQEVSNTTEYRNTLYCNYANPYDDGPSNNGSTVTTIGGQVKWSVTLHDNTDVSEWTFYFNDSGSFAADTPVSSSGTTVAAEVTKTITSPQPTNVCAYFVYEDDGGQTNTTDLSCFNVANSDPNTPTISSPSEGQTVTSLPVTLSGSTTDPDGDDITYNWYINGTLNSTTTGPTSSYNASINGSYSLILEVTDGIAYVNSSIRTFTYDTSITDLVPPLVTTVNPLHQSTTIGTSEVFECFGWDYTTDITDVSLYGNFTGSWALAGQNTTVGQLNFSVVYFPISGLLETDYKWGCSATDAVNTAYSTNITLFNRFPSFEFTITRGIEWLKVLW